MLKRSLITVTLVVLAIPALAVEIIPTAAGNRWEYECVKLNRASMEYQGQTVAKMHDTSSGVSVYEIVSEDSSSGQPVFSYNETTSTCSPGSQNVAEDKSELKITNGADGLRILSIVNETSGSKDPDKQIYDPPLLYFIKDAASGKSWEVGTMRDGEINNAITGRGCGRETVTVPAGTFKDCLKVIYSSDDISGSMDVWGQKFNIISGKSRGVYWVADGIGVVKELEVSASTAQAPGPGGGFVTLEGASVTINELKPGYVVKK